MNIFSVYIVFSILFSSSLLAVLSYEEFVNKFNDFLRQKKFIDLKIISQSKTEHPAHRLIMASHSPFYDSRISKPHLYAAEQGEAQGEEIKVVKEVESGITRIYVSYDDDLIELAIWLAYHPNIEHPDNLGLIPFIEFARILDFAQYSLDEAMQEMLLKAHIDWSDESGLSDPDDIIPVLDFATIKENMELAVGLLIHMRAGDEISKYISEEINVVKEKIVHKYKDEPLSFFSRQLHETGKKVLIRESKTSGMITFSRYKEEEQKGLHNRYYPALNDEGDCEWKKDPRQRNVKPELPPTDMIQVDDEEYNTSQCKYAFIKLLREYFLSNDLSEKDILFVD